MKMIKQSIYLVTMAFACLWGCACKKINIPNPHAQLVLGKWDYKSSSGGISGNLSSPELQQGDWVHFKETGKYEVNAGKKKIHSEKFKFESNQSIYNNLLTTMIVYDHKTRQSFKVSNDTLYLFDEVYDGFRFVFVKKN